MAWSPDSLFFSSSRRARLPGPLAERARALVDETLSNGERTTPDELADLIEAVFDYVYRLWVMEYANVDAPDPAVNRELFGLLARRPFLGQKVGLSRVLHGWFAREGRSTVVDGLAAIDFGRPGESDHPVARLITFRNGFAHGSFGASIETIAEHRALLEGLLERVPGLVEQPVVAEVGPGEVVALRGELERVTSLSVEPAPRAQPFMVASDGSARLDLYPMLQVSSAEGVWALTAGGAHDTAPSVTTFFEREALRRHAEAWQRERDGFLDHREKLASRAWRAPSSDDVRVVREALGEVQFVLTEGRPGCGKAGIVAALSRGDLTAPGAFDDVSCLVVEVGEPSHAASTFEGFVARAAERALGLEAGSLRPDKRDMGSLALARAAAARLAAAGKRVLIGIDDAHLTTSPPRRGEPTVAGVLRALVGSPVHALMAAHPGAYTAPLVHDRKIVLSSPEAPRDDRLGAWLRAALAGRPLHAETLAQLARARAPQALFELCDALDEGRDEPVFEPAVERALVDLAPVIPSSRPEPGADRVFRVFHPAVASALATLEARS